PQLLRHGRVTRGYLGLHARVVPIPRHLARTLGLTQPTGVEGLALEEGGPAQEAGLEEEDVIGALNDEPAATGDDRHRPLPTLPAGVPSTITILRGDRRLSRMVIPADYPVRT